ncbi:hypothetical protein GQ600_18590 [Phytophthora cactorum]|nr:hypothetical protein GQ600_18590 [Phytophthora cactorum]
MSATHSKPAEGLECMATMDDITEEDVSHVHEEGSGGGLQAELRRLVAKGPPIWLEDKHALPVLEGDTHIIKVWFAKDNEERSAKLDGAVEGEARESLWKELRQLMDAMEEDKEEVR